MESTEWRGSLACVNDVAGVGGRSQRLACGCGIPNTNTFRLFTRCNGVNISERELISKRICR